MRRLFWAAALLVPFLAGCNPSGPEVEGPKMKVLHIGDLVEGGVVVYVDPVDSTAGKIMELDYVPELGWCDLCERIGCLSYSDGVGNTAKIRASKHYPENYPALMHCDELGKDWYLPAVDEWMMVYTLWNGDRSAAVHQDKRDEFDALLASIGGKPMNPDPETTAAGQSYWTSTESEATNANAYYIRFGSLIKGEGTKKSSNRLTRCMKVVGSLTPLPSLELDSKTLTIGSDAGSSGSVKFISNYEIKAEVPEEAADWLQISISTFITGNRVIAKALTANNSKLERKATVRLVTGPEKMQTSISLIVVQEPGIKVVSHIREVIQGGIVVWQNPEDETDLKIVSLKRLTANKGWCDASEQNVETGALDLDDGQANTAAILALPTASKFHAAQYCKSMGEGWYLPAKNELLALIATYNGVSSWELCESGKPEAIQESAPAQYSARASFELLLSTNNGDVFNSMADSANGDSYWSSTESPDDVQKAFYLRVGAFDNSTMAKRGTARYARCFKQIKYAQ